MKTWLALIVLCAALLAALPAVGEPGDEPGCPWEYMPYREVLRLEDIREEQIVGGVKGSPYWLWQAYLGGGSIDLRVYDVEKPVFPKQLLFKERVTYVPDSCEKMMTLTVGGAQQIEVRVDASALAKMEQAGITQLAVKDAQGAQLAAYALEDIEAVFTFFALEEGETLCLQGEDGAIFVHSADGVRRAVTAGN